MDITHPTLQTLNLCVHDQYALQVLNILPFGLTLTDFDGQYVYVNDIYARRLGYQQKELIHKRTFWDLTPEFDFSLAQRTIDSSHNFGWFHWIEKHWMHKSGGLVRGRVCGNTMDIKGVEVVCSLIEFHLK